MTESFKTIEMKNQIKLLNQALPELSQDARLALHLRYWMQMSIEEIANEMGKSWAVTDRLIETSLKKLKHLLTKEQHYEQAA